MILDTPNVFLQKNKIMSKEETEEILTSAEFLDDKEKH